LPIPHPRQPDQIDQHVGHQVRLRRKARHMSMKELAQSLGITYQQVQKYETGSNRIPVSRLAFIAELLGGSPGDFYDDVSAPAFAETPQQAFSTLSSEKRRLLNAFDAIPTAVAKNALLDIADQMAAPYVPQKNE
jgi:transcriptional regulator with XRE-family HTH domain